MHNWITLLYTWNYHNTVNQLYSNKKFKNFNKNFQAWLLLFPYNWSTSMYTVPLQTGERLCLFLALLSLCSLLEKAMAPHSSMLAWQIPWTEELGRLQSIGSRRVGYDWTTWLSLFLFMHWRRKWQPTPLFLPGESQGRGSLVGCCLWGHTESDTTEVT